jgi:class 3 adenylate cyclase
LTQTQTVTILFTDMVGSTALSSRLDPEAADTLRQRHFSTLRRALAANAGTEVKNLGDGLMVVFASPSAAVACGVAMQQAVEQENRTSAEVVGLRVGLSGGEVTIEDDDYFGDPVVEAARLCALCDGGQILTTEVVRHMAGRRSSHAFSDIGERELKGLPDPVVVCSVDWEPLAAVAGVPLPERLQDPAGSLFGFFGRHAEVERLVEAVKAAATGDKRVTLLSGEPGIGKTSLSRQVAQATHALGVPVLYGRCDEDLIISYQPFAEALAHLVVHADEDLLRDHVAESGGALLSLVPQLAKRIPEVPATKGADPDGEQSRLFSAVAALFAAASAERGLLIVVDDLHWADKATLQLLRHVAGSPQLSRIMVVGTYRDSDLSSTHPLTDTLATLRREAAVERIDLVGLEDFEIVEMMEGVAGHEMDQDGVDLAHAVRRETEGNPFFTTEMLRHLGESGLVHQDDTGRWVASDNLYEKGLPQSVREVVGQRVDRLGEDMRRVLSQAAVIGRDFDLTVLAAVADTDEDTLLDEIDEAVAAGIVTEVEGSVERYSFAHALTQHTLYEDLGATRRARAHRKIAEVLEHHYGGAPGSHAADLAHHFIAATKTADTLKALVYSKMAGEEALAQVAPADALGWFLQALDFYPQIPPDETLHCDLLIGLGTAQRQSGDPAHRQTLLQAAAIAQEIGNDAMLVRAALANNRGGASTSGAVDYDRVRVLGAALDSVSAGDSGDRAMLLATLASELSFADQPERRAPLAAEALAMAKRLHDHLTLLRVTSLVYANSYYPENLQERLDDLARAAAIALDNADPTAELRLNVTRAISCLQAADRTGYDEQVARCLHIVASLDQPYEAWSTEGMCCLQALLDGDAERAERHANNALAIGAETVAEALTLYGVHLIEIRRLDGRLHELNEICDLMAQAAVDNPGLTVLQIVLARMYLDLGRVDEARGTAALDIARGETHLPYDTAWLSGNCLLAGVCVALDDVEGARRLRGLLEPWHAQIAGAGLTCEGPVSYALGLLCPMLGDEDAAERYLVEAIDAATRIRAPYWDIKVRLALVDLLRRRGTDTDLTRRAAVRAEAEAVAATHGLVHLLPT